MENRIKIAYFGTPEFAASQLEAILTAGFEVAVVVTMPDKPAGRGRKIQYSEVKKTALEHHLPLLQPEKLKDPNFLEQLASFQANLFIVVAFRMLPAMVWQMPELGTFNLHASLLPQYRGAAPINFAIINGETETGLTTFFLNEEIDKGEIIMRKPINIRPDETAGELHDELMHLDNQVVVETIKRIQSGQISTITQEDLVKEQALKPAPKISKEFCNIDWSQDCQTVYNHIRGLSPYPAAHTTFVSESGETIQLKIYASEIEPCRTDMPIGIVVTDNKKILKVALSDGFILLTHLQQAGKKAMPTEEFLRGTQLTGVWKTAFE